MPVEIHFAFGVCPSTFPLKSIHPLHGVNRWRSPATSLARLVLVFDLKPARDVLQIEVKAEIGLDAIGSIAQVRIHKELDIEIDGSLDRKSQEAIELPAIVGIGPEQIGATVPQLKIGTLKIAIGNDAAKTDVMHLGEICRIRGRAGGCRGSGGKRYG